MSESDPEERRRALRVPVRGTAVFHSTGQGNYGPMHGTLENLSRSGALVDVASKPHDEALDLELKLAEGGGWVSAHIVRIEHAAKHWRIAVAFDRIDPSTRTAIDATIDSALSAARRRAILVIDDRTDRRASLIAALSDRGMTPLAPRTPLEAIELLSRSQLHVSVCLLAPGFGVASNDLAALLSDSFPWVTTAEISDDLDATAGRAVEAWSTTPVARIAAAAAV